MISVNGVRVVPTIFPDGTSQVWKLPSACLAEFPKVFWRFESEAEVVQLAQLRDLLMRPALEIRFLPYGRQDKPVGNDATFALRSFSGLLNSMRWESVTIHDPHSSAALEFIERSTAFYYVATTRAAFASTASDVLCLPDAGARDKYAPLFRDLPMVYAKKVREQSTGDITKLELLGSVAGKRVFIVDDICDGGATFVRLAKLLRESGSAHVTLFVSHGIFSNGTSVLFDAGIDRVFVPEGEVTR